MSRIPIVDDDPQIRDVLRTGLTAGGFEVIEAVDGQLRALRAKPAPAGCADAIDTVHVVGVRTGPCRGG